MVAVGRGARGLGDIDITGAAAAVANAVFHATGRRVRDLPITLDKLLERPTRRAALANVRVSEQAAASSA